MRRISTTCGILLLALSLVGCGFKLRGQNTLPAALATVYLDSGGAQGAQPSLLVGELRRALIASGVTLTADRPSAGAWLNIIRDSFDRRTVATGRAAAVREYTLEQEVVFAITGADGEVLMPATEVRATRDVMYDESRLLGAEAGQRLARRELAREAASAVLRRIEATLSNRNGS